MDYDDAAAADAEVQMLQQQFAALTKQFYTDRRSWLAEKEALQVQLKQQQQQASAQAPVVVVAAAGLDAAGARGRPPPLQLGEANGPACSSRGAGDCSAGSASSDASVGDSHSHPLDHSHSSFSSARSISTGGTNSERQLAQDGCGPREPSAALATQQQQEQHAAAAVALQQQLDAAQQELDRRMKQWGLERAGLQRQLHALMAVGVEDDELPAARSPRRAPPEQLQELEQAVGALTEERDTLIEQLQVMAAEAAAARAAASAATAAAASAAAAATAAAAAAASSSSQQQQQQLDNGAVPQLQRDWGLTFSASVNVPHLLAEKASLERELRRLRDECVPVPHGQYVALSSVHSQNAFLENEIRLLREETADAGHRNDSLEAELTLLMQECVPVPRHEYNRLMRQQSEARAREARALVDGFTTVKLKPEEHRKLLAAIKERDALAERVASMHQQQEAASGDAQGSAVAAAAADADVQSQQQQQQQQRDLARALERVAQLETQLLQLQGESAALAAESSAFRNLLVAGQLQAGNDMQAAQVASQEQLAALRQEVAQAQHRVRSLESDLALAREHLAAARAEREAVACELGTVRDAAVRTTQALADCEAQRSAAEAAAEAAAAEHASLTQELVAVKLDLAAARELELLFKRDVFKSKRMLFNLPAEWIGTATSPKKSLSPAAPGSNKKEAVFGPVGTL